MQTEVILTTREKYLVINDINLHVPFATKQALMRSTKHLEELRILFTMNMTVELT